MRNAVIILILIFSSISFSQSIYSEEDVKICDSKFQFAASYNLYEKPINEIIVDIGKTFLGTEYQGFTLEQGEKEQLVIHLTGLDCYTFFESSLAFARCIKKNKTSFSDFENEILNIRYRNGILGDYPSRLHYASDWLFDNSKRGNVEDITKQIGGILYSKNINFMSTHSKSYKRLKANSEYIDSIAAIENEITVREKYYIPENQIDSAETNIKNGDIILITASAEGLDISHTGIAVKMENGRVHFMHAPLKGKKVQITEVPLGDYVRSLNRHTGIMVARPLEPNLQ